MFSSFTFSEIGTLGQRVGLNQIVTIKCKFYCLLSLNIFPMHVKPFMEKCILYFKLAESTCLSYILDYIYKNGRATVNLFISLFVYRKEYCTLKTMINLHHTRPNIIFKKSFLNIPLRLFRPN